MWKNLWRYLARKLLRKKIKAEPWNVLREIPNYNAGCGGDPFRFFHKNLWEGHFSAIGLGVVEVVLVNASSAEMARECLAKKNPNLEREILPFEWEKSKERLYKEDYSETYLTFPDKDGKCGGAICYTGVPEDIAQDIRNEGEKQRVPFEIRPGKQRGCNFG